MQWTPNFSPASQKNTNAQVWVNLWDLGLEFWEPHTLFEIAHGIGVPVKIDQNTLERKFGLFARVLVDIDLSYDPPRELVVRRNNGESVIVEVEYERLPDLCSHCGNVGHMVIACKLLRKTREASVVLEPVRGNNDSQDGGEGPSFASKSPTPAVDMHNGDHMVDQVVDAMVGQEVVTGEQAALVEQTIIVQPMEQEVVPPVIDMNVFMQAGVEQVVCDANGAMNVVERAVNQHAAPIVQSDMALRTNQRRGDEEGNVEKQVGDTCEETSDSDSGTRAANSSAPIDSWYEETEREASEFIEVVSRHKPSKKAVRIESREAYVQPVYARTTVVGRRKLWEDITDVKGRFVNGPWLVFGDFNAVLGMHEKKGGGLVYFVEMLSYAWIVVSLTWSGWMPGISLIVLLCPGLARITTLFFGDVHRRVKEDLKALEGIQNEIASSGGSEADFAKETELKANLNDSLRLQETFWSEKSRVRWLAEEDRNSSFFHAMCRVRRCRSSIIILRDGDQVMDDPQVIQTHIVDYYMDLFAKYVDYDDSGLVDSIIPSIVTEEENNFLTTIPSPEEILKAVKAMDLDSAPGPYGFNGHFFASCWDIVGADVVNAVQYFFVNGQLSASFNSRIIILIPKEEHADSIKQFRPIALTNFVFKNYSKDSCSSVVFSSKSSYLPSTKCFLPGRNISDCILTTSECFNVLDSKGFGGNVAVKVDITKAFDTLSWDFLLHVLHAFGFNHTFVH
ncbi:hypothetical protein ACLB2K_051015 [Fragaria x ananassa]